MALFALLNIFYSLTFFFCGWRIDILVHSVPRSNCHRQWFLQVFWQLSRMWICVPLEARDFWICILLQIVLPTSLRTGIHALFISRRPTSLFCFVQYRSVKPTEGCASSTTRNCMRVKKRSSALQLLSDSRFNIGTRLVAILCIGVYIHCAPGDHAAHTLYCLPK